MTLSLSHWYPGSGVALFLLKSLLRQGLSEPEFYGYLVYKLKKIVGSNNFSAQFIKIISHYNKIGFNINRPLAGYGLPPPRGNFVE